MRASKAKYKRTQPLLGTFFSITISEFTGSNDYEVNLLISDCFIEVSRLAKIFSKFESDSTLSQCNQNLRQGTIVVGEEFKKLFELAFSLEKQSHKAFNSHFLNQLDFSGIAKGFIVDCIAVKIQKQFPNFAGVINAGGDLRFFNMKKKEVQVRMGRHENQFIQNMFIADESFATSSPSVSTIDNKSSSIYSSQLRQPLTQFHTVSVAAPTCAVADGLTKVALFGTPQIISYCAKFFKANIFVFDCVGHLIETYGDIYEVHKAI